MPHRIVPPAERLLKPSGIAGLILGVALLLGVAAGSIAVSLRTQRATEASRAIEGDRESVLEALLALERAETGQRGFLLTGRDAYLSTYTQALRIAPDRLASLAAAGNADPALARLTALANAKLDELAHTIELAQTGRRDEALALVQTDVGQSAMDDYRALSAQFVARSNARLGQLVTRVNADTRLLVWLDGLSVACVLAVAALVFLGVLRAVTLLRIARRELALANAELVATNEGLELAVARRTAELTNANEEIQRFAYIVSHDLRSPLVNVMGFTSELEAAQSVLAAELDVREMPEPVRRAVTDDMPEAIRFIRASTSKMDRLINAILRLSREGRRRMTPEPLDMTALLRTVADTMAHAVQDAGAEVVVNELPALTTDRLAIEQVFANLVENALKYAKPGRPARVEVSGTRAGPRVRFTIADNGRGIATRDLDRIFDLFRRAGDQSVPGEGIGLAHVRALIRRLGGTITCASELGKGTVFTVDLPDKPAQQMDLAA